ncbi:MAG: sensor histidine kinase [Bryocella sp.]
MELPYHDTFAKHQAVEWTPMGGVWQIKDRAVFNRSDERGAKLLTGAWRWTNYQLTTDLEMIGHEGDVGVMVRVRNAERGVDSYNGYYIGLRSLDSALVIGRADHGWMEGRPVAVTGGVQASRWYRLRVVVVGCDIGAEATNLATQQLSWAAFTETNCVQQGRIGLRSMDTGGAWKNIAVIPASEAMYREISSHAEFVGRPKYPIREDDYSQMRFAYFKSTYVPARSYVPLNRDEKKEGAPNAPARLVTAIGDARINQSSEPEITLRGVVTSTDPLYVQDTTGGIAVELKNPTELNLGDEVELQGHTLARNLAVHFVSDSAQLLWDRTPISPVSATSTQAASGAFDSSLIEVRGILQSKSVDESGTIHLWLSDAAQNYVAVVRGGISNRAYASWVPGSELRIRGICSVMPEDHSSAFTMSLRSMDDVVVVSGPPWWTGVRVARLIVLGVFLVALCLYFYLRLERWKARAILDERERLAHEMHDTLAQSFAGVGFHLQGVRNSFRTGDSSVEGVIEKLTVACTLVATTHREASASIAALHPDADEGRDLLVALERYAQTMLDSNTLPMHLVREGTPRSPSTSVRDALFQIGREALSNVLRHSHAKSVTLRLRYEPKWIILEIDDNGVGFDYSQASKDFGIRTMNRRSEKVGAELTMVTSPGKGTTVRVRAPYGLRLTLRDWLRSMHLRIRAREV